MLKSIMGTGLLALVFCAVSPATARATDCNGNGTPDAEDIAAAPALRIYEVSPAAPISGDSGGTCATLTVSEGGTIDDLDVFFYIDHEAQGDLSVTLSHGGVTVVVLNRPGSNANLCGPSIYGYFVDDFGSQSSPLYLDDDAEVSPGIDCYDGSPTAGGIGIPSFAGPARPTHALANFDGMDPSGDWTLCVTDHLPIYNHGSLVSWGLSITSLAARDCNANLVPDSCDIASGVSADGNENGVPDECEVRSTVAQVLGSVSRQTCDIAVNPVVRSEPRRGGVTQLRVAFDAQPSDPQPGAVSIEQRTCAAPQFVPYTGSAEVNARVVGTELVLDFEPGLENARTYRISFDSSVTGLDGESVEFRVLYGDATGDGLVNALDRSAIIGAWQGGGFSCHTDINGDGFTTAVDRSIAIGVWTGSQNCAP